MIKEAEILRGIRFDRERAKEEYEAATKVYNDFCRDFRVDLGIMKCPKCNTAFWKEGEVVKCTECGYVFNTPKIK